MLRVWSLLASLALAVPERAAAGSLPGPAPQPRNRPAAALNRECEDCHVTIAREWRSSYHRLANQDPAFQRALAREPVPFCRRCHAPEADPGQDATGWAAENGVACVTCHVLDGQITAGSADGTHRGQAPHPLRRDARLAGQGACVRCHEFQFPDGRWRRRPELMQSTISEHRALAPAGTTCINCHMPQVRDSRGGAHRSHAFLAGHDDATLRAAVRVQAVRSRNTLTLVLTPQRVGHAFPTGDLFRRLQLSVTAEGEPPLPAQHRELMRHFATVQQLPGHRVRIVDSDDRLRDRSELLFVLPQEAASRPLRFRVTYQRVAFPIDQRGGPAVLDGEVLLASGVLAP